MLAGEFVITIPGRPAPKGSLKCIGGRGRHQLIEDNKRSDPWRHDVVGWIRKHGTDHQAVKGQPLGAEVSFTLPRPDSHHRTKRDPATGVVKRLPDVKPSYADAHPTGRGTGDVDKLVRLILDALQDAQLIPDDAAIVDLTTRKRFPTLDGEIDPFDRLPWPGVRIRLYPL
jgi:Holliday junction resolvase RusA-like endonuclease